MMNFILTHIHRHGTSVYLLQSRRELTSDDAIEFLGDVFEPDLEDEFVYIASVDPEVIQ